MFFTRFFLSFVGEYLSIPLRGSQHIAPILFLPKRENLPYLGWTRGIVTVCAIVVGPIASTLPLIDVLVESEALFAFHKVPDAVGAGTIFGAARFQLDVNQAFGA